MYSLEKIKSNIAKEINKTLDKNLVQASDLIFPPNPEMGDLSLACFSLAKNAGKNPAELASFLVGKLKNGLLKEVSSAKAIGPYLNFILNKDYLAKNILTEILKEKYGANKNGKGKRVMIEYSNANTHKEYHVGHLRNIAYGDAVNRILAANGFKTIPVSYINDFGIHVAKTLWALQSIYKNKIEGKNKGYFLGQVYVCANEALKKDDTAKGLISFMMKKIESRKGEEYKLWQKTRKWSIEYMDKIYKELGVKFAHTFYESEVIDKGRKMIADLYEKKFLIKSEGAVIADLNKYDLGVLVFLRSDGTALYPVADIPLAIEKFKKYKLDKSIYIVDIRQGLYFKQLFKILDLLGIKKEMAHLGYEFVKLPSGMMSSRTGNVITYEDLRYQVFNKVNHEIRMRHDEEYRNKILGPLEPTKIILENWDDKKIEEATNKIIVGAIKFEMIKVSREQIITFDIDVALRFDGFTAAYLQYTFARIRSIIKKAPLIKGVGGLKFKTPLHPPYQGDNLKFNEKQEQELIINLAKYPGVIAKAGENYNPAEIAKYLFELAQEFNNYYHNVPVLKAEEKIMTARLVLINAVSEVIKNGLGLLGIETVEEM